MCPNFSSNSFPIFATSAFLDMSHGYTAISDVKFDLSVFSSSFSFVSDRATSMMVCAQCSAKSIAACLPIPDDAPVINMIFPLNLFLLPFFSF